MLVYPVIFSILILLSIKTKGQYHLYYTDRVSETNLYYDCLHYKTFDEIVTNSKFAILQSFHQIIPYCIRPFDKADKHEVKLIGSSISSNFTFEQLKEQNITARDLLLWSASIDLIESYQNYLDIPTFVSASELFYNCTVPWFGPFCQYTFDSNEPFSEIVRKTFIAKKSDTNAVSVRDITNLTCYIHLECNRGPAPICLDWREICNGRIDCLDDGIDEKNCFDLELNECEQNEYRCHNGICIPEQFVNDGPSNPDCLDHTDENSDEEKRSLQISGFGQCYQNPTFLCEESNPVFNDGGLVCGDGQYVRPLLIRKISLSDPTAEDLQCFNRRDWILFESVLGNALRSDNLTEECQYLMRCIGLGRYGINCIRQLCENQRFPCLLPIEKMCSSSSYVMLPALPTIQAYAKFGYWTNKSITYSSLKHFPHPDFVCYDIQRCPYLLPEFKINNLTCLYMPNTSSLFNLDYMAGVFHKCLSVDESDNKTDCLHPSLFRCPNESKCISKHRLLDGIGDCPFRSDELYTKSCDLNHRHRFRCESKTKCISPILMRNLNNDCHGGEDENFNYRQKLPFQNLCNGYTHLPAIPMDQQNETDETNCEQWPCSNPYTQCDKVWTCPNGADEVNCDPTSKCYPNQHECVLPTTLEIKCLPMDYAGNGKVDCLGATDEREHCRRMYPEEFSMRYRCLNDTVCTYIPCFGPNVCRFEQNGLTPDICEQSSRIFMVFIGLLSDIHLGSSHNQVIKYFMLHSTSRFRSNASFPNSIMTDESSFRPTRRTSHIQVDWSFDVLPKKIKFLDAWICNRGILIFAGIEMSKYCLCPPSYYGNRCQFQNQRVSLTLQLTTECAPSCYGVYGIVLTLIDNDNDIHSYEQLTYISTSNCDMKYNLYLLYRTRPKNLTKNYTIRIEAYNKIDLTYYTSWILPIKFIFLPVNRIAAYLFVPAHPATAPSKCPLICGDHGRCAVYANTGEYFCRCNSSWSGWNCSIRQDDCDCSAESICVGKIYNRSICVCPFNKSGPRCLIHSVCRDNPCKTGGQCVAEDDRLLMNNFTCICKSGYSGSTCNMKDTSINISFNNAEIPQSLMIHLITVQDNNNPLITTIAKKIAFDQDSTVLYTSVLFNLIFIQIDTEFYLAFLQVNASRFAHIELEMKSFHHCSNVQTLFDERARSFPLLRRVKYYHTLCHNYSQLSCLHDNEAFMCLCYEDSYANCFPFDFYKAPICSGRTICENNARCLPNRATCPTSTMCICPECFYGGKCQFTTNMYSLSLDVILSYQIRPHVMIVQQPAAVKVSIVLATLVLVISLINGILSIMVFQLKNICNVGCGLYLLVLSISSLISTLVFTLKFWLLILSQIAWLTNQTVLLINCISMEFIIRSLLTINDWLSTCVAIERLVVVIKGVNFNQKKSKQTARWIIIGVVLCILLSLVHDPIHRKLIYDEEEQRTWCILQYSSAMKFFDSTMHIFHFFIPFSINIISSIMIIIMVARTHSTTRKQQTYQQYLRKQFHEQKHLIISPIILIILAFPRLVISFLSRCMKSIRNPWLYLIGYFMSFIPSLLTFVVFIWPSATYKKEFNMIIKRLQIAIRQRV